MLYVKSQTAKIYYELVGDEAAPVITFVSGYSRPSSDYKIMARYFKDRGYRALLFDNRGSGQTEVEGSFALHDIVDDIRCLWDALSIQKSHVLGISMGGVIAQLLAAKQAKRVDRLILISTFHKRCFLNAARGDWPKEIEGIESILKGYVSDDFYSKNSLLMRGMAKGLLKAQLCGGQQGALRQRAAMSSFDFEEIQKLDSRPTLIMHGDQDRIVKPESAMALAGKYPQSESVLLPGVGHLILAENPRKLYTAVFDFLQAAGVCA